MMISQDSFIGEEVRLTKITKNGKIDAITPDTVLGPLKTKENRPPKMLPSLLVTASGIKKLLATDSIINSVKTNNKINPTLWRLLLPKCIIHLYKKYPHNIANKYTKEMLIFLA